MNYRFAELLAGEDVGASGTKVVDININQPMSRIDITFKTTKASQGMSAGSPANISKIELVDGSRRLVSLTGYEVQALAYYNIRDIVCDHGQHVNTLSEFDTYPLLFGRELWDEMLAFDPTQFVNPQLRITFDEDVSDTSVTANEMEITAYIFDEKVINPIGFLAGTEHYDYTCGADNSFETIELPEDNLIRQILVRAYQDSYEPWYNIDEARLDENNLERIPFEYTDLEAYYRRMKSFWPMIVQQTVTAPGSGGQNYYIPQTDYNVGIAGVGQGGTEELYITGASGRGGKLALACTTGVNIVAVTYGYLPWHCYQFPMGKPNDPNDWYNPSGKSPRLRLRASTGATSATGQVILELLHQY